MNIAASIIRAEQLQDEGANLEDIVVVTLNDWQRSTCTQLRKMIDDWEGVDPDDKTLYTLGLRRAIDIVNGTYVDPLADRPKGEDAE